MGRDRDQDQLDDLADMIQDNPYESFYEYGKEARAFAWKLFILSSIQSVLTAILFLWYFSKGS